MKHKVGFTASAFDLLHAGHIMMLEEAKSQCDYLVCALHVDPSIEREDKTKPLQSITERQIQLEAVKYVDRVIVYQTEYDLLQILKMFQVGVRIIGEEYRHTEFTGSDLNMEIYFNARRHDYSSSNLRGKLI